VPSSAASSEPGTLYSPVTISTASGSAASSGCRTSARTGTPVESSSPTTAPPMRPVAPVTRMGARSIVRTIST
jgi:hypothetical protein